MTITDTHVQSFFTSVRHKKILSFLKDTPDLKLSVLARLVCRRDGESALSDNGIIGQNQYNYRILIEPLA